MTLNFGMGRVNTDNKTAASADQLAQFNKMISGGDYRGGIDFARSQGYSDKQIADYTGQSGIKDASGGAISTGAASSYLQGYDGTQQPMQPATPQTPQVDTAYKKNPFLDQMAQGITSQMNDNWTRNLAPSMRSGAMATGGFGGSRQGVVEANGLNDMNRSLGQNLTNLYGTDYTNAQNRNLQQQSINNSYDLGLRSSDLGFAGLDANINQNNFGNQLNSAQFGLNAYNTMGQQNNAGTTAAGTVQNQPLNYFNNASANTNSMANGYGTTTGTQQNPGNSTLGFLGGAQMGSSIYNQYK